MLSLAKYDKRNAVAVCTEQCLQGWMIRLMATHNSTETTEKLITGSYLWLHMTSAMQFGSIIGSVRLTAQLAVQD